MEGARQVDSFAYVTDLMPTILEMSGVNHPGTHDGRTVEKMRGRSLVGVTSGAQSQTYTEDALIGGEMINGKWMRKGELKAVLVAEPFGPGEWRLYDTVNDPGETTDLSTEMPELLSELKEAWVQYADDVGVISSN